MNGLLPRREFHKGLYKECLPNTHVSLKPYIHCPALSSGVCSLAGLCRTKFCLHFCLPYSLQAGCIGHVLCLAFSSAHKTIPHCHSEVEPGGFCLSRQFTQPLAPVSLLIPFSSLPAGTLASYATQQQQQQQNKHTNKTKHAKTISGLFTGWDNTDLAVTVTRTCVS